MQANRLIPIAVLAFAVACSDDATSPTSLNSVGGPLCRSKCGHLGDYPEHSSDGEYASWRTPPDG